MVLCCAAAGRKCTRASQRCCHRTLPNSPSASLNCSAQHLTAAGDNKRAVEQWLRAGRYAASRLAYREAIAHLERGLARIASSPDLPGSRRSGNRTAAWLSVCCAVYGEGGRVRSASVFPCSRTCRSTWQSSATIRSSLRRVAMPPCLRHSIAARGFPTPAVHDQIGAGHGSTPAGPSQLLGKFSSAWGTRGGPQAC